MPKTRGDNHKYELLLNGAGQVAYCRCGWAWWFTVKYIAEEADMIGQTLFGEHLSDPDAEYPNSPEEEMDLLGWARGEYK